MSKMIVNANGIIIVPESNEEKKTRTNRGPKVHRNTQQPKEKAKKYSADNKLEALIQVVEDDFLKEHLNDVRACYKAEADAYESRILGEKQKGIRDALANIKSEVDKQYTSNLKSGLQGIFEESLPISPKEPREVLVDLFAEAPTESQPIVKEMPYMAIDKIAKIWEHEMDGEHVVAAGFTDQMATDLAQELKRLKEEAKENRELFSWSQDEVQKQLDIDKAQLEKLGDSIDSMVEEQMKDGWRPAPWMNEQDMKDHAGLAKLFKEEEIVLKDIKDFAKENKPSVDEKTRSNQLRKHRLDMTMNQGLGFSDEDVVTLRKFLAAAELYREITRKEEAAGTFPADVKTNGK